MTVKVLGIALFGSPPLFLFQPSFSAWFWLMQLQHCGAESVRLDREEKRYRGRAMLRFCSEGSGSTHTHTHTEHAHTHTEHHRHSHVPPKKQQTENNNNTHTHTHTHTHTDNKNKRKTI